VGATIRRRHTHRHDGCMSLGTRHCASQHR
jgi:hypothetical protein